MTLLPILYWVILILSVIGYFVPGPAPQTWGYRLSGGAGTLLFIIIGLKIFKMPL